MKISVAGQNGGDDLRAELLSGLQSFVDKADTLLTPKWFDDSFDPLVDCFAFQIAATALDAARDIVILAKAGRYNGSCARLRAVWEARLRMAAVCAYAANNEADPDAAGSIAEAFALQAEAHRVKELRKMQCWNNMSSEERYIHEFAEKLHSQLGPSVATVCRMNERDLSDYVERILPGLLQESQKSQGGPSAYELAYPYLSAAAHAGRAGNNELVRRRLESQSATDDNWLGLLITSHEWLMDVFRFWRRVTPNESPACNDLDRLLASKAE